MKAVVTAVLFNEMLHYECQDRVAPANILDRLNTSLEGQIDHAMGLGKRVFSALQPAIQDMGGSQINRAMMQGISGYEQGRNEIMGQHSQVQAHLSRLRRAAPELDL